MPVVEKPRPSSPTYPGNVREFARRLHEQNGWTGYRIRLALKLRGYTPLPAEATIKGWIDEDYREERNRRRRKGRPFPRTRMRAWRGRLERMRELREIGISYTAIAALMSHDFEEIDLSEEQVRSILQGKVQQQTVQRLLWPQGATA